MQAILKLKSEDFLKGNNAKFRGKSIPTRGPCSTAGRQKVVDEVSEEARVDRSEISAFCAGSGLAGWNLLLSASCPLGGAKS